MIDDKMLKGFREDFKKLNEALELKYGVALDLSGVKYSIRGFTATLTGLPSTNFNEYGEPDEFEKLEFERLAPKFGYKPEDYKKEVEVGGHPFKLVGFNEKARKRKFLVADINDKVFVCRSIDK